MGKIIDPEPAPEQARRATDSATTRGVVQRYFPDIQMGTIKGADGETHTFKRADWTPAVEPKAGDRVIYDKETSAVRIRLENRQD